MYCSVNGRCQPDSLNSARYAQIRDSTYSGAGNSCRSFSAQAEGSKHQNKTRAGTEAL